MSEILARARGDSQAIINFANAEARSVKEIARAVPSEDPTKYLLASKYIEALDNIATHETGSTQLKLLPKETAFIQMASSLGLNYALLEK